MEQEMSFYRYLVGIIYKVTINMLVLYITEKNTSYPGAGGLYRGKGDRWQADQQK